MDSAMDCEGQDLRIDNFIQFQPKGCLNQQAHFVLYCIWFIFFMYNAIEMCAQFISPLPGRSVTVTRLITQASYLTHLLLQAGFCLIVIIQPYASVLNLSQGLAMAIILVVSPACFILTLSQLAIEFTRTTTKALLLSTGSIIKDRQRDVLYKTMVVFAILLPTIIAISNFLLFIILPFVVFTDPYQQQVSWNVGFIVMGSVNLIIIEVDAAYWWRLRSIALEQIRFSSSLAGGGKQSDSLIRVAQNMRYLAVGAAILGLFVPLLLIIVPAVYGTPYWLWHTIQGIISTALIPSILLLDGSAISRILWRAKTRVIKREHSHTSSVSLSATKQLSSKPEDEDATTAFDHNVPEKKTDDNEIN